MIDQHQQPINGASKRQALVSDLTPGTTDNDVARTLGLHRPRRRLPIGYGIGAALLVGVLIMGWVIRHGLPHHRPAYRTQTVQRGSFVVTVTATGTLEPLNQVDVGSELSGIIAVVDVDNNDRVTRGQRLAQLDTEQLEARTAQSQASLTSALAKLQQTRATVGEAQRKLVRSQALARKGLIAQQTLEIDQASLTRAEAESASARAQVALARARLKADRTDLSKAVITSPIDGIVLSRNVEPGQTVAASFQTPTLFTIAEDLTRMALHVDFDEADIGQVREGQEATFTVDAYPKQTFLARIVTILNAPQTVDHVVTYKALLAVDNASRQLRPGMTATAEIVTQRVEDALLVPNGALRFTPPGITPPASVPLDPATAGARPERVWTLQDDTPVPLDITTGRSNGRVTEVVAGDLQPGLPVLVDVMATPGSSQRYSRGTR